jgi:hypothetical protein
LAYQTNVATSNSKGRYHYRPILSIIALHNSLD